MAKAIYNGVANVDRKVKQPYRGVSNVSRKVTNGYLGVANVTRQFYTSETTLGDLAVGTTVFINHRSSDTVFTFKIVHKGNPDPSLYGSEFNESVWLLLDVGDGNTCVYSNTSKTSGYPESTLNSLISDSDTIKYPFPLSIENFIKTVNIPYVKYTWGTSFIPSLTNIEIAYYETDRFVLSWPEIDPEFNGTLKDGALLDYFASGGSDALFFRFSSSSSNGSNWWTRTTGSDISVSNTYAKAKYVICNSEPYSIGEKTINGSSSYLSKRPCFIFSPEALIDENFYIIA